MTQSNSFLGIANVAMAATPLVAVVMTIIQYLAR
jgi:hypothetical protein